MPALAFFRASAGGWFDRLIARFTRGPYSHVEIVFSDGMSFSSMAADRGVRFKQIRFSELTRQGRMKWDFLTVPCRPEQEAVLRAWCETQAGKKYDWRGMFTCRLFGKFRGADDDWFCSELCTYCLQKLGHLRSANPARMSPADLYREARSAWLAVGLHVMPHIDSFDDEQRVLRDIGCVVGDALQMPCYQDQIDGLRYDRRVFLHK